MSSHPCRIPRPAAPLTPARRQALRDLLARLEPPDCDCPPILACPCEQSCPPEEAATCRHCREECDCHPLIPQPSCRHVAEKPDPAVLFELTNEYTSLWPDGPRPNILRMIAALQRAAYPKFRDKKTRLEQPGRYDEPTEDGFPEVKAVDPDSRVRVMAERESAGLELWNENDAWWDAESVGVQAVRLRNGAVAQGEVKRA